MWYDFTIYNGNSYLLFKTVNYSFDIFGRLSHRTTTKRVPKTLILQMKSIKCIDRRGACVCRSVAEVDSVYFCRFLCIFRAINLSIENAKWHDGEGRKPKPIKINRPPPPLPLSSSSVRKRNRLNLWFSSITMPLSRFLLLSKSNRAIIARVVVGRISPNAPPYWYHAIGNMMSYTHSECIKM